MVIYKGLVYFRKSIGGQLIQKAIVRIQFLLYMGIWNCAVEMEYP